MNKNTSNFKTRFLWDVPTYEISFWKKRKYDWCVVIPVINEGERIKQLLERIAHLDITKLADIIIVDGGTTDGSIDTDVLNKAGVSGLLIKTGAGKLSAQLRCAYAFALDQGYEGIVTIDGNNKDDPISIPQFIEALRSGFDFVQASRFVIGGVAENTPKIRNFAIRFIHAPILSLFSGFKWTDTTQGFRAYSRAMLIDPRINIFRDIFMTYELLAYLSYKAPRVGYRCVELPTIRRYPSGDVPTKISMLNGNFMILKILFFACLGFYDPKLKNNLT